MGLLKVMIEHNECLESALDLERQMAGVKDDRIDMLQDENRSQSTLIAQLRSEIEAIRANPLILVTPANSPGIEGGDPVQAAA